MSLPEPLPKEELDALFRKMRKARRGSPGYKQTRDTIIEHNTRFALWMARKYVPSTLADEEDLTQAAIVGLIKAVDSFDPDAGYAWPMHARLHITHEITAEARKAVRVAYIPRDRQQAMFRAAKSPDATREEREELSRLTKPASIDMLTSPGAAAFTDPAPSPDEVAEETDATARLHAVVRSLPGMEAFIIAARLGLNTDDGEPRTLRSIAAELGIPESKASKLEARGFARLRHPSRSARLDAYA